MSAHLCIFIFVIKSILWDIGIMENDDEFQILGSQKGSNQICRYVKQLEEQVNRLEKQNKQYKKSDRKLRNGIMKQSQDKLKMSAQIQQFNKNQKYLSSEGLSMVRKILTLEDEKTQIKQVIAKQKRECEAHQAIIQELLEQVMNLEELFLKENFKYMNNNQEKQGVKRQKSQKNQRYKQKNSLEESAKQLKQIFLTKNQQLFFLIVQREQFKQIKNNLEQRISQLNMSRDILQSSNNSICKELQLSVSNEQISTKKYNIQVMKLQQRIATIEKEKKQWQRKSEKYSRQNEMLRNEIKQAEQSRATIQKEYQQIFDQMQLEENKLKKIIQQISQQLLIKEQMPMGAYLPFIKTQCHQYFKSLVSRLVKMGSASNQEINCIITQQSNQIIQSISEIQKQLHLPEPILKIKDSHKNMKRNIIDKISPKNSRKFLKNEQF